MSSRRITVDFLGTESTLDYAPRAVGYAVVAMRLGLGWMFFHAGVARSLDAEWNVARFVQSIPSSNPLVPLWTWLGAHASGLVDPLMTVGFTVVGTGLIFGAGLRASALLGAVLMGLSWTARVSPSTGLVTDHLIYALFLFGLGALGAGRLAGLDAIFERHPVVERHPSLRLLLG